MNKKKCNILLLIGSVVIGMSAMTVSAEDELITDDVIEHDASNGERDLDIAAEEDNSDNGQLIIAPLPDGDLKETAVLAGATENDEIGTIGIPILGAIGIIASIAIAAVLINKRK